MLRKRSYDVEKQHEEAPWGGSLSGAEPTSRKRLIAIIIDVISGTRMAHLLPDFWW
jgi:hypothetical protein